MSPKQVSSRFISSTSHYSRSVILFVFGVLLSPLNCLSALFDVQHEVFRKKAYHIFIY